MTGISFFTPISFCNKNKTTSEAIFEAVDGYLSFGSQQVQVIASPIDGEKGIGVLSKKDSPLTFHSLTRTSLLALSYFTIIIPAVAFVIKAGFRSQYQFTLIDPKTLDPRAELEKGIPLELQEQIQANLPRRIRNVNITQDFRLRSHPELIIKMNLRDPSAIQRQFQNRIDAKRVCMMYQLNEVLIPQTRLIEGANSPFIIEQALPIPLKATHPKTIRQITTFILKTGFHPTQFEKDEKALEKLINSLASKEQIDIVLSEVKRQTGIIPKDLQDAKTNRLKAIATARTFQNLSLEFGFVGHLQRSNYSSIL